MKLRLLTKLSSIDINHGSSLFDLAFYDLFKKTFPFADIKYYEPYLPSTKRYELLRAFKLHKKIPFYNLQRYWKLTQFGRRNLNFERLGSLRQNNTASMVEEINKQKPDAVIVGKVIWDIVQDWKLPEFPNILWLSPDINAIKIAFAVSGHRTDLNHFRKVSTKILEVLRSYALIGVRDNLTLEILVEAGVDRYVPVVKILDAAFRYQHPTFDLPSLQTRFQIDPDRPKLGLLMYGKPELSKSIAEHYQQKGYQVINFNMFNPFAERNIGHLVDPHEWAALFQCLSFCVTDRFHASIFCIRSSVPFVAIEPSKPKSLANSKIYDLLNDFSLLDCYQDPFKTGFQTENILEVCKTVQNNWSSSLLPDCREKLQEHLTNQENFVQRCKDIIGN